MTDPTVLVVDDERDIARLYATWLETEYDVRAAYDGEDALQRIDDSVDVVFLDRQMPGLSGDVVLERIDERDIDCRVVMVTAVDPDFDIVDMPFDDYLTKPVTRDDLVSAVEEMVTRGQYDEDVREYFSMAAKKATLETEKNRAELEASDEYTEVSRRVDELRRRADRTVATFDDYEGILQELPGSG